MSSGYVADGLEQHAKLLKTVGQPVVIEIGNVISSTKFLYMIYSINGLVKIKNREQNISINFKVFIHMYMYMYVYIFIYIYIYIYMNKCINILNMYV